MTLERLAIIVLSVVSIILVWRTESSKRRIDKLEKEKTENPHTGM